MDASARPALSTTLELEVAAQELCARPEDFAEGAGPSGAPPARVQPAGDAHAAAGELPVL